MIKLNTNKENADFLSLGWYHTGMLGGYKKLRMHRNAPEASALFICDFVQDCNHQLRLVLLLSLFRFNETNVSREWYINIVA